MCTMNIRNLITGMGVLVLVAFSQKAIGQDAPAHAITNVTIHLANGETLSNSDLLWRDGVIVAIGNEIEIPFDAYTIDGGDSLHVFPGLIDGLATWGSPEQPRNLPNLEDPGNPPYDRAGVQPERKPVHYLNEDKGFKEAMKAGFTLVALGLDGQMLPGQIQPFNLSAEQPTEAHLFSNSIGLQGSFDTAPGGWGSGAYPSTQMGVMAYFRQLMYDAAALQEHMMYFSKHPDMPQPQHSEVLEALFPLINAEMPLYFEVDSKEEIERLFRLQDEFGFKAVLVGAKHAAPLAAELNRRDIDVLATLDVNDQPKWMKESKKASDDREKDETESEGTHEGEDISEEELSFRSKQEEAWTNEIQNIRKLLDGGVKVGFTSDGLSAKDLQTKITLLIEQGSVTSSELLSMMTHSNAEILGLSNRVGDLKAGMGAHLILTTGPLFEKGTNIYTHVSQGVINDFMEN